MSDRASGIDHICLTQPNGAAGNTSFHSPASVEPGNATRLTGRAKSAAARRLRLVPMLLAVLLAAVRAVEMADEVPLDMLGSMHCNTLVTRCEASCIAPLVTPTLLTHCLTLRCYTQSNCTISHSIQRQHRTQYSNRHLTHLCFNHLLPH